MSGSITIMNTTLLWALHQFINILFTFTITWHRWISEAPSFNCTKFSSGKVIMLWMVPCLPDSPKLILFFYFIRFAFLFASITAVPVTVILAFLPQRCPEPFAMANRYLPVWGFPGGPGIKNLPAHAGDLGLIPGRWRSPGGGHENPLQCSCLGNSVDRGAWRGTVCGVARVGHDWVTEQKQKDYYILWLVVDLMSHLTSPICPWLSNPHAPVSFALSSEQVSFADAEFSCCKEKLRTI